MKRIQCLTLAAGLIVGGCGGNDGSGGSGSGTVIVPPITAPAPTPSPTPAPVIDFSADLALVSTLGYSTNAIDYTDQLGSPVRGYFGDAWMPDGQVATLNFTAANRSVRYSYGDATVAYTAADLPENPPKTYTYVRDGGQLLVGSSTPGMNLQYVLGGYALGPREPYTAAGSSGTRRTLRAAIFGFPSKIATHIEASPTYLGRAFITGGADQMMPSDEVRMFARSGRDQYFGSLILSANENATRVTKANLVFTGTLDDVTTVFSGTLSDTTNGFSGTFRGALFGPNREEMAIVYRFSRPADGGASYIGDLFAKRN